MKNCNLFLGDCLEVMKELPNNSVDFICCDPPYGTTSIKWDEVIDFHKMWDQYERIIKPKGVICLFGSQPFSAQLICSKIDWFRYELVWNKNKCGSPGLAKYRPMNLEEHIIHKWKRENHIREHLKILKDMSERKMIINMVSNQENLLLMKGHVIPNPY
jgi:site-specific DNA-methyltransferase (adenine-specific)